MKTVFLLLDACKTSYVNRDYMPFLYSIVKGCRSILKIKPSPGYCERSEIFTGLDCFDSGNFTAIGYDRNRGEYQNDYILQIAQIGRLVYKRGAKYFLQKYRNRKGILLQPYYIPPYLLKSLFLTEDGCERLRPYSTIFDILNEEGKTYCIEAFTSLSDNLGVQTQAIDVINKAINTGYDFIPVYYGVTDIIGHKYGNEIDAIKPYLSKLDREVEDIYFKCKKKGYNLCVLGDHGMVPVKKHVNIVEMIKKLKLDKGGDFYYFLDSTYARFWIQNGVKEKKLRKLLIDEFGGINNFYKYRIPLDIESSLGEKIYGDLVWCANPGVLIFPDFFNNPNKSKMDRGMHGYLECLDDDSYGFYASSMDGKKQGFAYLYEVCDELCTSLDCKRPNKHKRG